jgi:hypothetical protein
VLDADGATLFHINGPANGGTTMADPRSDTEQDPAEQAENEHALDPNEHWGQGTDASHPISAIDAVSPDIPTAATTGNPTPAQEATDTAERLRRSVPGKP